MEYEIVLKVKVDKDYFYWLKEENPTERQGIISQEIHNIIYDTDDIKVLKVTTSELSK